MRKLDELSLAFTSVNRSGKCIAQLELSTRKTKCLGRINQALPAAKEVVDRWGSDVARLREIPYAYGTFAAFIDCCGGCLEQSLASVVYFSHVDKRRSHQVF